MANENFYRWPRDRRITRERHQLKNPSGRLLRELQQLDDEDPVLAAQAARLVGLYRRLWSSYVAKHADGHRLGKENRRLERSNHRLSEENRQMSRHYADQEAQLHHFQEAFRKVREAIIEIFARWKDVEPELAIFSQDRDAPHDKQSNPDSAGLR